LSPHATASGNPLEKIANTAILAVVGPVNGGLQECEQGRIAMKTTRVYRTARIVIFALTASGAMVSADYAFALNYRHQAAAMCDSLVGAKGLKGEARKAEYNNAELIR
jgi:hypothetical protein